MGYKDDLSKLKENINLFMVDSILFKQNASKPWNSQEMNDLKVQMGKRAYELKRLYEPLKIVPSATKNFGSSMDDFLVNIETFLNNFQQMTLNITPSEYFLSSKEILRILENIKPDLLQGIESEFLSI